MLVLDQDAVQPDLVLVRVHHSPVALPRRVGERRNSTLHFLEEFQLDVFVVAILQLERALVLDTYLSHLRVVQALGGC